MCSYFEMPTLVQIWICYMNYLLVFLIGKSEIDKSKLGKRMTM